MIAQTFRAVRRVNAIRYRVKSQSGNGKYEVRQTNLGGFVRVPTISFAVCSCKHVYAVEFSLQLEKRYKQELVIQPISQLVCRYCNSEHIVKKAIRRNKQYDIQRYLCKDCGKRFSFNIGFEKMQATPDAITSAMQFYFSGESFRNVNGSWSCRA